MNDQKRVFDVDSDPVDNRTIPWTAPDSIYAPGRLLAKSDTRLIFDNP